MYRKHVALRCGCSVPAGESLDSSAVGIAQLVLHESRSGRVHSLREEWLRSFSQITLVTLGWSDVLPGFLLYMSAEFEFGVFLSRDAMLAWYAFVMCPSVWCGCGVPTAEWIGFVCSGHCTGSSRRVHYLPWGAATRLFPNDFGGGLAVKQWGSRPNKRLYARALLFNSTKACKSY